MVPLSKSGVRKHRGFESHPLRQTRTSGMGHPGVGSSAPSLTHRKVRSLGCSAPPWADLIREAREQRPPAWRAGSGSRRGRLVDYGAALEMRFAATRRGFESPLSATRSPRGSGQAGVVGSAPSLTHVRVRSLACSPSPWPDPPARRAASVPGRGSGQAGVVGSAPSLTHVRVRSLACSPSPWPDPPARRAASVPGRGSGQAGVVGSAPSLTHVRVRSLACSPSPWPDPPARRAASVPGRGSGQAGVVGSAPSLTHVRVRSLACSPSL